MTPSRTTTSRSSLARRLVAPAALLLPALLAGCGDDATTPAAPFNGLTGVAATGAPVVSGTVDVTCAGGTPLSTTTDASGRWSVNFSGQTLPCKVKVSGGNLTGGAAYHSVALQTGTVNITPLTDIVVASLAQGAPSTWFTGSNFGQITQTAVDAAVTTVKTALNLPVLASVNPLTTAFVASTSDPVDQVLEALGAAVPAYSDLLDAAASPNLGTFLSGYATAIQAALTTASGGGTGGGGGNGAPVTCDLNKFFDPIAAGQFVRSPTANEFASFVKTYTEGGVVNGTSSVAGTATLAANGTLTMNGVSYQATSICYDTQIGASSYGNTLYVHFNGGKADLWQLNSNFAGVLDGNGGSTGGGSNDTSVSTIWNSYSSFACSIPLPTLPGNQSQVASGAGCGAQTVTNFTISKGSCTATKSSDGTITLTNGTSTVTAQLNGSASDTAIPLVTTAALFTLNAQDQVGTDTSVITIALNVTTQQVVSMVGTVNGGSTVVSCN